MRFKLKMLIIFTLLMLSSVSQNNGIIADISNDKVNNIYTKTNLFSSLDSSKVDEELPIKLTSNPSGITHNELPIQTNVVRNGDFEEMDTNNLPRYHSLSVSSFQNQSLNYDKIKNSGSYSALLESQSPSIFTSDGYIYRSYTSNPIPLNEGLNIDLWFYIINNPSIANGGDFRIQFSFFSQLTSSYPRLDYYLSINSRSLSNGTSGIYILNQTAQTWNNIQRNVTSDYENAIGTLPSDLVLRYIFFYSRSGQFATNKSAYLLDDVSLKNTTLNEYITNGGFESGPTDWFRSGVSSPGTIAPVINTADSSQALNISVSSVGDNTNGFASDRVYFPYQKGYFNTPGTKIEFDWNYQDTANGGSQQSSYFYLRAINTTNTYNFYWYLGADLNKNSRLNFTTNYYMNATNFGSRGNWQRQTIDLYDVFISLNLTNLSIYFVEFYTTIDQNSNSSVQLLIDNLSLITDPFGDPGFEQDWNWQSYDPFTSWYPTGNYNDFNITNQSHQGKWAANLTLDSSSSSGAIFKDPYLKIDSNMYTDFWWYLDKMSDNDANGAYFYLYLQGGNTVYYYLGASEQQWSSLTNTSYEVYYKVNNFNETGQWTNMIRNLDADLDTYFGENDWVLESLYTYIIVGSSGKVTLFVDDLNMIRDTHGPEINSINILNNPTYYEDATIQIDAYDILSEIKEVRIHYNINGTWTYSNTTKINATYMGYIPLYDYKTNVQFYIEAIDSYNITTVDDNSGSYYSYFTDDDIKPSIKITNKLNNTQVSGNINIQLSASDIGSGISNIELYDNGTIFANLTTSPFEYLLNTRSIDNGVHVIDAIAFDNKGNSETADPIYLEIDNDILPPTLSEITVSPVNPETGDSIEIVVGAIDGSAITNVTLSYKINNDQWQSIPMIKSGFLYRERIPSSAWNSTVYYYVTAEDVFGQTAQQGSEDNPFEIIIVDTILPQLSVIGPLQEVLTGIVEFKLIGSDDGSGIRTVGLFIDNTSIWTDTSLPQSLRWDTTTIPNGNYSLEFIAEDLSGNRVAVNLAYQIDNPEGQLEKYIDQGKSYYDEYGFFIGVGSIIGLLSIVKVRSFFKRRKKSK